MNEEVSIEDCIEWIRRDTCRLDGVAHSLPNVKGYLVGISNNIGGNVKRIEQLLREEDAIYENEKLSQIREAITEYHRELDTRQDGHCAADHLVKRVQAIMDMQWQG